MSLLSHRYHEDRPWGSFDRFTLNETTTVKILQISNGQRFSLQTHDNRSEWWRVIEGSGIAQIGEEERAVKVGDELEIPAGTLHRLTGGENGMSVLEITFGTFDENDIHRVADDFDRT